MLNTATGGEKHRFRSDSSSGDREQGKFLSGWHVQIFHFKHLQID